MKAIIVVDMGLDSFIGGLDIFMDVKWVFAHNKSVENNDLEMTGKLAKNLGFLLNSVTENLRRLLVLETRGRLLNNLPNIVS